MNVFPSTPGAARTEGSLGEDRTLTGGATGAARQALTRALEEAERNHNSWDRMVALTILGDLLLRTPHLGEALNHYEMARDIVIQEATRDPGNVQWQNDVAVSCSKLGTHRGLTTHERRNYLQRGLQIQEDLKTSGRLAPNQNWISWFEEQLTGLAGG